MADDGVLYMGNKWSESAQQGTSASNTQSTTRKVLDQELLRAILSGLGQTMTDKEIGDYAKALLEPQLRAGLEAAEQTYETKKLSKEQQEEELAASLARAIAAQQSAYRQSMADVETAALKRGMGRSSYTMSTLANKGAGLAEAIRSLTDEDARTRRQLEQQLALAAQQRTQTTNRLNTDYAANMAAKIQELRQAQQERQNNQYMSAVSAAMGSQTSGSSTSTNTGSAVSVSGDMQTPEGYTPGRLTQSMREKTDKAMRR